MSERANEWAHWSERAKRAVRSKRMSKRYERTSERRSKWPSTLRVDFIVILPNVRSRDVKIEWNRSLCLNSILEEISYHVSLIIHKSNYRSFLSSYQIEIDFSNGCPPPHFHSLDVVALVAVSTRSLNMHDWNCKKSINEDIYIYAFFVWRAKNHLVQISVHITINYCQMQMFTKWRGKRRFFFPRRWEKKTKSKRQRTQIPKMSFYVTNIFCFTTSRRWEDFDSQIKNQTKIAWSRSKFTIVTKVVIYNL